MTETEWIACDDVQQMLTFLSGKTDERTLRLFACACCRQVWDLLLDERSRQAVAVAEQYAEGSAGLAALERAARMAWEARPHRHQGAYPRPTTPTEFAAEAASSAAFSMDRSGVSEVEKERRPEILTSLFEFHPGAAARYTAQARPSTAAVQPDLLRHLVGNPFRPCPVPRCWPRTVIQMTQVLVAGEDIGGPLADALDEAGHPTLAEHFRREHSHPKGCWAIELILKGRTGQNEESPAETST